MTAPRPDLAVTELRDWLRKRERELEAQADEMRGDPEGIYLESAKMMEYAAALDHLLAERAAYEWRPIETAPKDGTRILVTDIDHPELMTVVSWVHGQWKCENPKGGISHWIPRPAAPQPKGPEDV